MEKEILAGVLIAVAVSGISLAGTLLYLSPRMGFGVLFLFYANLFIFLSSFFAICGIAGGRLFSPPKAPARPSGGDPLLADKNKPGRHNFTVLRRSFLLACLFIISLIFQKAGIFGYLSAGILLVGAVAIEAYFVSRRPL